MNANERAIMALTISELERAQPDSPVAAMAKLLLQEQGQQVQPEQPARQTAVRSDPPQRGPYKTKQKQIKPWAEEAKRLYEEGGSLLAVSVAVGSHVAAVRDQLAALGVKVRPRGTGQSPNRQRDQERIERLRAGHEKGMTAASMALLEGISHERVRQLLVLAGISTVHELTPEQKQAAREYGEGDESLDAVAERYKTHPQTLRRWVHRCGYDIRPAKKSSKRSPVTVRNADMAAEMYRAGAPIQQIAEALGYKTGQQVYRLLSIAGVARTRASRKHLKMGDPK